ERSEQKLQNFINENFLVCENIKIAVQNIETLKKLLFEEDFIMPEKSDLLPLMERIIFLKKIPIFSRLEAEKLTSIANLLEEKNYPENIEICKENTPGEALYIVVNGELKKENKSKNIFIETIKNYSFFGELSLLDDKNHSYTVTTVSPSKLFIIQKKDFLYLLEKNSAIGLALIKQMCFTIRELRS
ncbi:cyclic nucleotide-binding domain-containing protein, partial [Candidatus Dependentiae bacterium]|nr:cyclic nucleotide-binding domain-containing protein [Candidatus Dependentiae bacterium]